MKKIGKFLFLTAFAAVSLVSCLDDDDNGGSVDPYANIRPGLSIYNAAVIQNSMATDPAAAAVRLAMLLDEAAAQEKAIDDLTVVLSQVEYSLKDLLFGSGTMIGESEETPGDYRVQFIASSPAVLDAYRRDGAYLIHTGGVSLAAATADNPWSAELASGGMYITGKQSSSSSYRLTGGKTQLWRQDNGEYRIELEGMAVSFSLAPQFVSDWSGTFCWSPSTESDNLTFQDHSEDSFSLYGEAQGGTLYALNNLTSTRMSYLVSESTPLVYQPHLTLSATKPTGGVETARLTDPSDYSETDYPSPTVQAGYTVSERVIYTTIFYNGVSQTL